MLGFMGYFLTSVYIFYQSCMFKLLCFNVLLFVDHHVRVVGVVCGCAECGVKQQAIYFVGEITVYCYKSLLPSQGSAVL